MRNKTNHKKPNSMAGYMTSCIIASICTLALCVLAVILNNKVCTPIQSENVKSIIKYVSYGSVLIVFVIVFIKTSADVSGFVSAGETVVNNKQNNFEQLITSPARVLGFDVEVGNSIVLQNKNNSMVVKYVGYTVENGINHYKLNYNGMMLSATNEWLSNEGYKISVHK